MAQLEFALGTHSEFIAGTEKRENLMSYNLASVNYSPDAVPPAFSLLLRRHTTRTAFLDRVLYVPDVSEITTVAALADKYVKSLRVDDKVPEMLASEITTELEYWMVQRNQFFVLRHVLQSPSEHTTTLSVPTIYDPTTALKVLQTTHAPAHFDRQRPSLLRQYGAGWNRLRSSQ